VFGALSMSRLGQRTHYAHGLPSREVNLMDELTISPDDITTYEAPRVLASFEGGEILAQAPDVAPLEIIAVESLEGLDGLRDSVSFSGLIDEKTSDPRTRAVFFKNFLVSRKALRLQMNLEDQRRRAKSLQRFSDETSDWIVY
jgi:hypothetical protein